MTDRNHDNYEYEDENENPPSLLNVSGGWWENLPKKPLLVGGAGVVLVILLVTAVFTRSGDKFDHAQVELPAYDVMERMHSRFERIEERMEQIEMKLTRLPGLIHQVESMEIGGDAGKMEQLVQRMQRLDQRVEGIRKETTQVRSEQQRLSASAAAAPSPPQTRETGGEARRYHEVRKGDTLFSIARTNNIPLDALLERNNLNRNSVIRPGDRLVLR